MSFAAAGVIFVLIAFATSQEEQRSCSQIAKSIESLTPEFNEPVGRWMIYKTTHDQFACRIMIYASSIMNGTRVSWVQMSLRNSPDVIEYLVTLVPAKTNQYVSIRKHDGAVGLFYHLAPDVPLSGRDYFCGFSCERDGIFVESFQCFVKNMKVIPTVDKVIEEANMPLRPNTYMFNLFEDECDLSLPEKTEL